MFAAKLAAVALTGMLSASPSPAWQYSVFPAKFVTPPGSEHSLYVSNTGPKPMRVAIKLSEIKRVSGRCVNVPVAPKWAHVVYPPKRQFTVQPGTRRIVRVGLARQGATGSHDLAVTAAYVMGGSHGVHSSAGLTAQGLVKFPGKDHAAPCLSVSESQSESVSWLGVLICLVGFVIVSACVWKAYRWYLHHRNQHRRWKASQ